MKKFFANAYGKVKRLFKEEKGGAEIIATIILVAVVVLLALFFREQIGSLISNIWNGITEGSNGITSSFGTQG